ncbi:MAG: arginine repressor [Gammaproteobacteria bacterium]|nr:arginine repressor [Gammaproteobacteria bacterium]MDE2139390.1 arginine repressor [Gammaproteobacteria bacterium]MDE2274388.1 arginine repressor [Gammaproteobacteria bacterium]
MTLDEAILKIAHERQITDQSDLLALLGQAGHNVTQPTLSRHLRKLSIQKLAGRYQRVEQPAAEMPAFEMRQVPPNMLVIRTRPGFAQPLAVKLDQRRIEGVAGTLAGDDTVFIAVAASTPLKSVSTAVEQLLTGSNNE